MKGWVRPGLRILAIIWQALMGTLLVFTFIMMVWIALSIEGQPREVALVAVLAITMTSVIIAAFFTAAIHKAMNGNDDSMPPGEVFRESIKRYAWLAAPLASGYGLSQIAVRIAEIIS
jgi:hypothetical protein